MDKIADKECPCCRSRISDGSEKCPSCGLVVQGLILDAMASNIDDMDDVECPYCAEKIKRKAIKCKHCGSSLNESESSDFKELYFKRNHASNGQSRNRGIYIILALFFGYLGVHNFYAGYYGKGAMQLLITLIACIFGVWIGFIVPALWALVEVFAITEDANSVRMI